MNPCYSRVNFGAKLVPISLDSQTSIGHAIDGAPRNVLSYREPRLTMLMTVRTADH